MIREAGEDGRERILRRLRAGGTASVRELAEDLGVSPVTIHRYLSRLEHDGLISRPRGGARLLSAAAVDLDFEHRMTTATRRKQAIAQRALEFLPGSGSIFIDASTTCAFVAREIERRMGGNLTIVTSSPEVLRRFSSAGIRVIALPGELDPVLRAILGPWTVEFLEGLNLDVAFISGAGITLESGLSTSHRGLADLLHQVVRRSREVYLLVDSTKFGRNALLDIVEPWAVAGLITDTGLDVETAAAYRGRGVNLIIADD